MAEYMEKLTKKGIERLRIFGGIKRRDDMITSEINEGIPPEDPNAYSFRQI